MLPAGYSGDGSRCRSGSSRAAGGGRGRRSSTRAAGQAGSSPRPASRGRWPRRPLRPPHRRGRAVRGSVPARPNRLGRPRAGRRRGRSDGQPRSRCPPAPRRRRSPARRDGGAGIRGSFGRSPGACAARGSHSRRKSRWRSSESRMGTRRAAGVERTSAEREQHRAQPAHDKDERQELERVEARRFDPGRPERPSAGPVRPRAPVPAR